MQLLEGLRVDVAAWLCLHPAALAHIWDFGGERQRVEHVPKWVWSLCLFIIYFFIHLFKQPSTIILARQDVGNELPAQLLPHSFPL